MKINLASLSFIRRLDKWRLSLLVFIAFYISVLSIDLGYMGLQWDEAVHAYGGLLLAWGELQKYAKIAYYPPLFDILTAFSFQLLQPSAFSVRLVSLIFGGLCIWACFEYAYRLYGQRQAILSAIFLSSMPGFIWLCRMALLDVMLTFFFTISLFLFFSGWQTQRARLLYLSGITLGLGLLTKYPAIIGGIIMLISTILWKERLSVRFSRVLKVLFIAAAFITPWICFVSTQKSAAEWVAALIYTLKDVLIPFKDTEIRVLYSTRFPTPIFYLFELPGSITLPIYLCGILGLGLWLWRRRREDKFSLIWFLMVYVTFTLIPNKIWRFVMPIFPLLSISAADFVISIWQRGKEWLGSLQPRSYKIDVKKVASILLISIIFTAVLHSAITSSIWIVKDYVDIPTRTACQYVVSHSKTTDGIVILCASNWFSPDVVNFYLHISDPRRSMVWQYPEKPVDAYKVAFDPNVLNQLCVTSNAKYLLLYENTPFFEPPLTTSIVLTRLIDTNKFVLEKKVGIPPDRIFIIRAVGRYAITLSLDTPSAPVGGGILISGKATTDGLAMAGAEVHLIRIRAGTRDWIFTLTTDGAGAYSRLYTATGEDGKAGSIEFEVELWFAGAVVAISSLQKVTITYGT